MKALRYIVLGMAIVLANVALNRLFAETPRPPACAGPQVVETVTVHAWHDHVRAVLIFVFVDQNCDKKEDIVLIYQFLGMYAGKPVFALLDIIPPETARQAIADWERKCRERGQAT